MASLAEFKKRVTMEAIQHRIRKSEDGFAPKMLCKETKPSVLSGILATARSITCIAINCLHQVTCLIKDSSSTMLEASEMEMILQFRPVISGLKAGSTIFETGPPSWVEEQRVVRACWSVHVFYDLKKAAAHSLLSWPAEDIAVLNSSESLNLLYKDTIPTIPYDEFVNPHPEFQEISSVVEYTNSTISSASDQIWTAPAHREVSRNWPTPKPQWKNWKKLVFTSPGYHFYFRTGEIFPTHSEPWRGPYSTPPLCFTRFGVAFWAEERISAYGLLAFTNQKGWAKKRWPHFCCYAWQGILSNDEIIALETRANRRWVRNQASSEVLITT